MALAKCNNCGKMRELHSLWNDKKREVEIICVDCSGVNNETEDRKEILLKAAYDILKKCSESSHVLSATEQTAYYDEADCDGLCLMEDIANELGIEQ